MRYKSVMAAAAVAAGLILVVLAWRLGGLGRHGGPSPMSGLGVESSSQGEGQRGGAENMADRRNLESSIRVGPWGDGPPVVMSSDDIARWDLRQIESSGETGSWQGAPVVMSSDDIARCDLVEKYRLGHGLIKGVDDLWIEGVMRQKGPWPFRILRLESTDKAVVIGSGAVDVKGWTIVDVQPTAGQEGTVNLKSIHNLTLPPSDVAGILHPSLVTGPEGYATAIIRRGLASRGWPYTDDHLAGTWFEAKDANGWVSFTDYAVYGSITGEYGYVWGGRVSIKDQKVEFTIGGGEF